MFGTADQWISGLVLRVKSEGLLQDLSGRIVVGGVEGQAREQSAVEFHLCALRERLVNVFVFAGECVGIDEGKVNLIPKQVVEIDGGKRIPPRKELLLHPRLKGAVFFRSQMRIGNDSRSPGESL